MANFIDSYLKHSGTNATRDELISEGNFRDLEIVQVQASFWT